VIVPRWVKGGMYVVDIGFLAYWLSIAMSVLPASSMFDGYADPRVQAWNWSFLPLDVAASATGLSALRLLRIGSPVAGVLTAVSLTLTAVAGGMAIAYWAVLGDVELLWWAPNLALLVFGVVGVVILCARTARTAHPASSVDDEDATLVA
jgi:hypothetical protein